VENRLIFNERSDYKNRRPGNSTRENYPGSRSAPFCPPLCTRIVILVATGIQVNSE
jgi:hypothetical protein